MGASSIDLTAASNAIYESLDDVSRNFTQSMARINRTGQTRDCKYWFLVAKNTIEEDLFENTMAKMQVSEEVLEEIGRPGRGSDDRATETDFGYDTLYIKGIGGTKGMPFRLISGVNEEWKAEGGLPIAASGDGHCIRVGDDIYVLTKGESSKLLARLSVLDVSLDTFRHRIDLQIGGPRSAVFFDNSSNAVQIRLPSTTSAPSRYEVRCLDQESAQQLAGACGSHDFSSLIPIRWDAIAQQVGTNVARAKRDGDPRPDLEIAESFLRRNYVTSQLPGPAPVYQNAARRALGFDSPSKPSTYRERYVLTNDAIIVGINEDVSTSHHTPDSKRHQEILDQLRRQLERLGFTPKYDGLVDCIVETAAADIYFEVKSATRESVAHQIRTGLGQVLHYIWIDSESVPKALHGHLVVEGPWRAQDESLRVFVRSCSIGLTWSSEIESLDIDDFSVTD